MLDGPAQRGRRFREGQGGAPCLENFFLRGAAAPARWCGRRSTCWFSCPPCSRRCRRPAAGVSLSSLQRSVISLNPELPEAGALREWWEASGRSAALSAAGEGLESAVK